MLSRPDPPRRRVDLRNLSPVTRYVVALATVALVVGLVWWLRSDRASSALWYRVTVQVGAVILLAVLLVMLVRRLFRRP